MEHAKLSSPPTAKGQKKMLQIQLQKPRKKAELPSQKKGAIAQANAAAIQDAVSRKTRSNVKGDISSRTRQSSTHTAPLLEKKRSSYRKQKGSPSKALAANNPEEGPLPKKAKRSPSKPKQKVSPAKAKRSPSKAKQKVSPAKASVSNKPEVGSKPRKSSPKAKAVTTRTTKGKKSVASADDTPKDTDVTTRREPILSTRKASPKGKTTTSRREPIVATGKSSPKVKANKTPSTKGKKSVAIADDSSKKKATPKKVIRQPIVDDLEEDVNSDDEDDSVSTTTSTSIVSQPTVPSKKKVSKKKLDREPIVKSKKKPPSKQLSEASIPKDSGESGNDESFSVLSHTKSLREPIVVPPKKSKKVSPKKVIKKYISSPSESETEELQVSGEVKLLPASIAEQTGKLEDADTALLVVAVLEKPASGVVTADVSTLDAVSAGGVIGASLDGESGVPSTVLWTIDATQDEPLRTIDATQAEQALSGVAAVGDSGVSTKVSTLINDAQIQPKSLASGFEEVSLPSASKINDLPPQLTDKLDGDQKMPSVELDDSLNRGPNPVTQDLEPDPNRLDAPEWLFNQVLQQRSIPSSPPPVDDSGSPISKAIYAVHLAYKRSFPNSNNLVPSFMEFIARINCDDQSLDDENTPADMFSGAFFTGLPIAWFVDMMQSTDLNVQLGGKRIPIAKFKKDKVSMFTKEFPKQANYRFWVIHHNGLKANPVVSASITKHKQLTKSVQKLQKGMVDFFTQQFDQMHKDETEAISRGMISDCDTLYVVGIDNASHYHIIAAVQYVATPDAVYINWLGVEHKISANVSFSKKQSGEKRIQFRKLGLGTFMLNLVQMQQIGRGHSHTLILQTNPTSRARVFYERRGFRVSDGPNLESIPQINDQTFLDRDTHFVSEASQREDGTDTGDFLVLLYQPDCLFTQIHGKGTINVEDSMGGVLFQFPFDCDGSFLDNVVIPEDDWLFAHPVFKPPNGVLYALRNATDTSPVESLFREDGMYNGVYDSVVIEDKALLPLQLDLPLSNPHVDLWSCWMLRHLDGDVCNDVLIVPLCVTESIEKCFALLDGDYANLGKPKIQVEMAHCLFIVDKYLWGHPDLLEKRLILMATTEKWIGFALLNPWVRLVKEAITSKKQTEFGNMKKKKFDLDTCVSGMICNKSYSLADSATDEVVIPLYLLNLASHFRDLRLHGKHTVFNFEAMVKNGIPMWYFFFLGYTGPFCNLHDLPEAKDNNIL